MIAALRCQFALITTLAPLVCQDIRIDGHFDDWRDHAPILRDAPADASGALVDFGDLQIAHDQTYLYFAFTTGSLISLQAHRGSISLFLSGNDSDLQLQFSPRRKQKNAPFGAGASVTLNSGESRFPHEFGVHVAPSYAARRFELRIDRRRDLATFRGDHISGKLVFRDSMGRVRDETETFRYRLDIGATTDPPESRQDPLTRLGDLRVLDWNTKHGALFARPAPFARILRGLEPDLLMLQEIEGARQWRGLGAWFAKHLPGTGKWYVLVAGSGGDLRSALVSRLPMQAVDLGLEAKSAAADRLVAGLVQHGVHRLLAVSLHLRCCGHLDSREDLIRRRAAIEIRAAIAAYLSSHRVDAVIIAGDLNLVGSREPLDLIVRGSDLHGGDLRIAEPFRFGGSLQATWRGARSWFLPGRLDYLMHSPKALRLRAGYVFASEELTAPWQEKHGIENGDSRKASDHLPLVFDFSWL